jgi:hypothetical protein
MMEDQFSRSEISVFKFSVSSRIAVTTYPRARLWMLVRCSGDGEARNPVSLRRCRITAGFACGEERTLTFLMFGVPQINFRGPVIRR